DLGDLVEHGDFFAADLVVYHSESRLHVLSPLYALIFFIDACQHNTAPGKWSFSEISYFVIYPGFAQISYNFFLKSGFALALS
ncbi:MAG: hypothetical protein OEV92_08585, partial [Nitrospinota bacterium]|nr:hypothetical protein [Nitrospinota bacterium]